jgi:hypothetical protein
MFELTLARDGSVVEIRTRYDVKRLVQPDCDADRKRRPAKKSGHYTLAEAQSSAWHDTSSIPHDKNNFSDNIAAGDE